MRELEVAWSGFIVLEVGRKEVDDEAAGKATPKIDPDEGYIGPPGVLAVSRCFVNGMGSYDDADESVCVYWLR